MIPKLWSKEMLERFRFWWSETHTYQPYEVEDPVVEDRAKEFVKQGEKVDVQSVKNVLHSLPNSMLPKFRDFCKFVIEDKFDGSKRKTKLFFTRTEMENVFNVQPRQFKSWLTALKDQKVIQESKEGLTINLSVVEMKQLVKELENEEASKTK